jgi:hypothetical protein
MEDVFFGVDHTMTLVEQILENVPLDLPIEA